MTDCVIASHPRCTNPSVTPLRAATAPLSGEPRAWEEVCGVYAHVYHVADTVVFLPPVRGGVLDAPWLRDCRGGLGADIRLDRLHPRLIRRTWWHPPPHVSNPAGTARAPLCGVITSHISPRTISYGSPTLSFIPSRAGVEARPYGGHPHLTHVAPTPQSRRKAPRQLPFQGSRGRGRRFAAFAHLFTTMLIPPFR